MTDTEREGAAGRIAGDGGDARLVEGWFDDLVSEAQACTGADPLEAGQRRTHTQAHDTRFCLWTGQTVDGLKHKDILGTDVRPFNEACDLRVALVDQVVTENVATCVLAALQADMMVRGMEGEDEKRAANARVYLRWVLNNELGFAWVTALSRLANYVFGDSPGVGLMRVWWRRREGLVLQRLTAAGVGRLYVEGLGPLTAEEQGAAEAAVGEIAAAIESGAVGAEDLALTLKAYFPLLTERRARRAAAELVGTGACEFPVRVVLQEGVRVEAGRFGEDWWIPSNTRDFQESRAWFAPELLTATQVREAAQEEGWSESFRDAVLKSVGSAHFRGDRQRLEQSVDSTGSRTDTHDLRGLHEVIRVEFRAATDDGVAGVFETTFSMTAGGDGGAAKQYAYEPRLTGNPLGGYSGHVFAAESLNGRLLDSRGWAERLGAHQTMMKLVLDTAGNHARFAPLPPIKRKGIRTAGAMKLASLRPTDVGLDGDLQFLEVPRHEDTAYKLVAELGRQADGLTGRPNKDNPEVLASVLRRYMVAWWLANVREVLRAILTRGQAFETPERLKRIVNDDGLQLLTTREELAGRFDIELAFDPEDWDKAALIEKAKAVADLLLSLDAKGLADKSAVAAAALRRLAPEWATLVLRGEKAAALEAAKAAREDMLTILAGREPERAPDGSVDYAGQLAWFNETMALNPRAYDSLPEDRRALLAAHLQYLSAQGEQYGANRQIGREGAKRAELGAGGAGVAR